MYQRVLASPKKEHDKNIYSGIVNTFVMPPKVKKPAAKKKLVAKKKPMAKKPAVKKNRKPYPKRAGSYRDVGRTAYQGPQKIVTRREAITPHTLKLGLGGKMRYKTIPPNTTAKAGRILASYRWGYSRDEAQKANRKALTARTWVAIAFQKHWYRCWR